MENIKTAELSELEARKAEIDAESTNDGADLDALLEEIRAINEEIESRKAEAAKQEELRKAVAAGAGTVIEKKEEERKMPEIEIRNTKEYIDEYAEYLKTGEKRKLLTENATNGTIPVPEMVYDVVKHAWESDAIMKLVKKSYIKGVLKVGFESTAGAAVVHTEGADAPNEETLVIGTVTMVPAYIKKWISVSDEVLSLTGEAFLRYVYEEVAHQIAHKAADELVAKIVACGTTSGTNSVAVPVIEASTVSVGLVAQALGQLSDEATNPVIMMNKLTWSSFKNAQIANGFNYDPFEGLPVVFNNSIKAFGAASDGDTFAIVGDLGQGALANFPDGEELKITYDDISLSAADLVKITGKENVALGVVAPYAFAKITLDA